MVEDAIDEQTLSNIASDCQDLRLVANSDENDRVCWGPLQTRKVTITRVQVLCTPDMAV